VNSLTTSQKIILGHRNFRRKIYLWINLMTLSVNRYPDYWGEIAGKYGGTTLTVFQTT